MATTDAKPVPVKGAAYRVTFPIFDADGDLVTGATGLDSEVSKDAGTFADCTNEATEIATSSGVYYLDLTSTEMNADTVAVIVKTSSSGAKTTPIFLYPQEAGDIPVTVEAMNAGTVTAAAVADGAIDAATFAAGAINAAAIATDAIGSDELAASAVTEIQAGLSTLDASGVRSAVGLVSANLDTQIGTLATASALSTAAGNVSTILSRIVGTLASGTHSPQSGDAYARLGAPVGASHAADVANVAADVTTLLSRLSALRAGYLDNLSAGAVATASALSAVATSVGLTATAAKLLKYVQLLARKDAAIATDNATELTAINASGGSGAGSFDNTTDSEQALRDRGDAAWTTGSSVLGSGSEAIRIRCLNGAAPVDGAAVWITTDSAGTNVVAGTVYTTGTGYTSTLMLDPGTYYVWRQANGVNFTNPETITVSDL